MSKTSELIGKLKETLGEGKVLTGEAVGADFCHDELPGGEAFCPDAVCEVKSTEEVSAVMKLCSRYGVGVTTRGAGTGKAGGSVPVKGGIVLSMKGMNAVISFDEQSGALTVQPGVLLQDVKAEAQSRGLYYPPDPGEKTATIGGNVATNAAGPCAVRYGCTCDYVMDATLVLADGSICKISDRDELRAVIGSEGTLAVITELCLKLVEKPACEVILLLPFMDMESCINAASRLNIEKYAPAILEAIDTDLVEFSGNVTGNPVFPVEMDGERVGATLMLCIEGNDDDELDEKMEAVAELSEELECLDILVVDTPTLKKSVWEAYDAFHSSTETAKCAHELNISAPTGVISELIDFAKTLSEENGFNALCHSHAGSGGLHIHLVSDGDKAAFIEAMKDYSTKVYAKCLELGGEVRGEYGIGYSKKDYFSDESIKALKAALDPEGILNPGKVL